MAGITIRTDSNETGEVKLPPDKHVRLIASADSGTASNWIWKLNGTDLAGQVTNQYQFDLNENTEGTYSASADIEDAQGVKTRPEGEITITRSPSKVPDANGAATGTEAPRWDTATAVWVALGLVVVGGLLGAYLHLWDGRSGFSEADWAGLDGRLKLAAEVVVPLVALGGVVVLIGVWMAIVEWRGRFRAPSKYRGIEEDLPKIIEAIGKLQGAALVLVVGVLVLFAAAWIAQSGVGAVGASPSPSASLSAVPSAS
jgi:hypothetical protein